MKLLFQQRFFSWFDSYDIYDEDGNTVYVVKGQLSGMGLFHYRGSRRAGSGDFKRNIPYDGHLCS